MLQRLQQRCTCGFHFPFKTTKTLNNISTSFLDSLPSTAMTAPPRTRTMPSSGLRMIQEGMRLHTGRRCKGCNHGAPPTTSSSTPPKPKSWGSTSGGTKQTCSLLSSMGRVWGEGQVPGFTSRRTYPGHPTPLHW